LKKTQTIFQSIQRVNNRRIWTVFFLGFSSGLPLALTAGTLQAWLTIDHISTVAIGAFGLVGLPYVYKFIWSPLMDRYIPPFLGRRRGWMLIAQLALVFSIAAMALIQPEIHPLVMFTLALLTAFCSASQDIALDAYRTDLLLPEERGLGAAMNVSGYRIAMLVSGALALVMATYIGWKNTYLIISMLMVVGILATWFGPEIGKVTDIPVSLRDAIVEPFREFMSRKSAVLILLFIILYKLGDAFTLSLSSTFLLRGLHFSLIDVATVNKFGALLATIVGAILGGLLMVRLKLFKSLLLFGVFQAISILTYMWLAIVGKSYALMVVAIVLENLCGGMGTAAFVALLMALCDSRYTATQFALLSALAAIGRVFVGPIAGMMVEHFGWAELYWWSFVFAIPGLVLLVCLQKRVNLDELGVVKQPTTKD
jgi:MFS transporter, PAT family, beta-lactamase induction signal transducer AmpG